MVSHTGAGNDAGVAELHRGAHPPHPAGGQRVDGNDQGRLDLLHQSPHRLGGLHTGGTQNTGAKHRHRPETCKVLGHGGDQMPGDEDVVRRQGTHGVRCHRLVAQADDQRRTLSRQQRLQLRTHRSDGPLKKIRLSLPKAGEVNRQIAALGLSQGLLSPFIQNVHPGHRVTLLLRLCGLDSGETGGPLRRLLP